MLNTLGSVQPSPASRSSEPRPSTRGSVLREGVIAGLIGAATVALWFFVLDLARGMPLFTPSRLGAAVFYGANNPLGLQRAIVPVLGYTVLHALAFIAFGVVAATMIVAIEREPPLLLAFLMLFAGFEVFFVGLVAAFSRSLLGDIVWWSVLIANLLASAAMLSYLFRLHPAYGERSPFAAVWFATSIGAAAALAIGGIVTSGWDAISWAGAAVWGMVAAVAFLLVALPLWRVTEHLDFLDLLGSIFVRPGTAAAQAVGLIVHLVNGALFGIAWAYGTVIFGVQEWGTGFVWGLVLWGVSATVLNTIGSVHPAIRRGERPDPVGSVPSLIILPPHLIYGAVLDGLYHWWPF